jgi:8-oxo-dGTP pyrophosphatase MutT (NUDIX family)
VNKNDVLKRLSESHAAEERRSNEDAEDLRKLKQADRNAWIRDDLPLIPAAVLVPLINRPDGMTVLLTKRTEHLSNHAGQISFPGGRTDDDDRDARHTALRETEEEVGLGADAIEIIGQLDNYVVGTGYLVTPFIGIIEPPVNYNAHDHEVAEIFEPPLKFLMDPLNMERHARKVDDKTRNFFAVTWKDYYIWGATAGMLRNLSEMIWDKG